MALSSLLCGLFYYLFILCLQNKFFSPVDSDFMGLPTSIPLFFFITLCVVCLPDALLSHLSHLVIGPSVSRLSTHTPQGIFSSSNWVLSQLSSRQHLALCYLLLVGNIESNPGPNLSYPCGVCNISVTYCHSGIFCDSCSLWFHTNCIGMSSTEYDRLSNSKDDWYCTQCCTSVLQLPNCLQAATSHTNSS